MKPTASAVVEAGLWQAGPGVVTLGGEIGGSFLSGGYQYDNNYSSRTVIVAARAAWHYGWQVPGLDTYGGVPSPPLWLAPIPDTPRAGAC
jgi:hypothetical protein